VQIRNSSATACAKSGRFKWYRFGIPLFACLPKIVQSQTEIGIIASLGRGSEITGNSLPIIYCPGCGTSVETEHYRKNSEPWYLRHKSTARDLIE
jgi:hypothetical protein